MSHDVIEIMSNNLFLHKYNMVVGLERPPSGKINKLYFLKNIYDVIYIKIKLARCEILFKKKNLFSVSFCVHVRGKFCLSIFFFF